MATDNAHQPAPYNGYHLYSIEQAHTALNRSMNFAAHEVTDQRSVTESIEWAKHAHTTLSKAVQHDGPADAVQAAHNVLPRITRVLELLDILKSTHTPAEFERVVGEYNKALDVLEQTMDAANWD